MNPSSQQLFLGTRTQSESKVQVKNTPVRPSVAASPASLFASPPASSMPEVIGGVGPGPVALQARTRAEEAVLVAVKMTRRDRRDMPFARSS